MPGGIQYGGNSEAIAKADQAKKKAKVAAEIAQATQSANDEFGTAYDSQVRTLLRNKTIMFNPPTTSFANGVAVLESGTTRGFTRGATPRQGDAEPSLTGNIGRDYLSIFEPDPNAEAYAHFRKGYIIPDTTWLNDFNSTSTASTDGTLPANSYLGMYGDVTPGTTLGTLYTDQVKNSVNRLSAASAGKAHATKDTILKVAPGGGYLIYGFKFMYNPTTLDFSLQSAADVNTGYIMAMQGTAKPMGVTDTGGTIGMSILLSRVEDMQAIYKKDGKYQISDGQYAKSKLSQPDIDGIKTRGTMYDLEFLFRSTLGKEWETIYRGKTADVGLMYSVPLVLQLGGLGGQISPAQSSTGGGGMMYRVFLRNVSYTHRYFTPDMVPTVTEVSLSFQRIPDALPDGGYIQ